MESLFRSTLWKVTRILILLILVFAVAQLLVTAHYSMSFYGSIQKEPFENLYSFVADTYLQGGIALVLVIVIALAGVVDLLSFYFLTKRFRAITEVVNDFADGNLEKRVRVRSYDEIGRLGKAFNEMADAIAENIDSLEATDRLRRELVANVAHDLKSPLTSIQGYAETVLMKDKDLEPEKRRELLKIILVNTRSLVRLVEELFELSKLDAAMNEPVWDSFPISTLVFELQNQHQHESTEKHVSLEFVCPSDSPPVFGDVDMIRRALSNLIANGIRYTPEGGSVTVRFSADDNRVEVSVQDTGIGIPEEDLPYVFDRFYRVDKDRSRESGGAGLGLAIVRKIVEAHGEEITVESKPRNGTVFKFYLPYDRPGVEVLSTQILK